MDAVVQSAFRKTLLRTSYDEVLYVANVATVVPGPSNAHFTLLELEILRIARATCIA